MSRSGYSDDCDADQREVFCWRGAVRSAIRGRRGQEFLREMLAAFDALPTKRLIEGDLVTDDGECCAIGAVALARKQDVSQVEPYYPAEVSDAMGIARAMAQEIEYENDDSGPQNETPEQRWSRMRRWVCDQLINVEAAAQPAKEGT